MRKSSLGGFPWALMAGAALLCGGILIGPAEPGVPELSELSLEAEEAPVPTAPIQLTSAPACVRADLDDTAGEDVLVVTNDCGYQVRLEVLVAYGPDLTCRTYAPGDRWTFKWSYPGHFDKLVTC
jgi:hypothetical protein